jgi:hypothetical protein
MRSRLIQLPPVVLAVLLQLAPLVRWMSSQTLLAPQSAWAVVLRLSAGTAALLGAADAVSGASDTVIALGTNPAPSGTNGVQYTLRMDLSGTHANDSATWTAKSLPAGILLTGTSSKTRFLSGIPTQSGSNWVTITATHTGAPDEKTSKSFAIVVVSAGTPPTITSDPSSAHVVLGGDVSFTVTATGSSPLSYQWKLGTNPLPTGTNATLSLTGVTTNNVGSYSVVVSNPNGTATSQPALLSLAEAPAMEAQSMAGQMVLTFPAQTGVIYRVESTTDLAMPNWQFVTNITSSADMPMSITNSIGAAGSTFLRLKLQAP